MIKAASDQVWLITGANSGFGLALCQAVLRRGGRVVAAVRSPQLADAGSFGSNVDHVLVVKLDVTDPDKVRAAIDAAVAKFERIDVVVNSAGRGSFGSLEDTPVSEVRDVFEVNVFGSLNVVRAVLPIMRGQQSGHIIQISSLAGIAPPAPGLAAYAATKFAVEGMSEVLAMEVADLGVGVTIVEPGDFLTGFGSALHVTPACDADYESTVGAAAQRFASVDPSLLGDPDNAAEAIIDAVNSPRPPLRLALGDDAVDKINEKLSSQIAETRLWEAAGRGM